MAAGESTRLTIWRCPKCGFAINTGQQRSEARCGGSVVFGTAHEPTAMERVEVGAHDQKMQAEFQAELERVLRERDEARERLDVAEEQVRDYARLVGDLNGVGAKFAGERDRALDLLERLRRGAQRIWDEDPVRDWDETLVAVDALLAKYGRGG